jgi:hypothetical protein
MCPIHSEVNLRIQMNDSFETPSRANGLSWIGLTLTLSYKIVAQA